MELDKEIKELTDFLKELKDIKAPQLAIQIVIHNIEEYLNNKKIKWQEI